MKLTADDVRRRVAKIASLAGAKDGRAHGEEDSLYLAVLRELAAQGNELAAEAIKTQGLPINRWYE